MNSFQSLLVIQVAKEITFKLYCKFLFPSNLTKQGFKINTIFSSFKISQLRKRIIFHSPKQSRMQTVLFSRVHSILKDGVTNLTWNSGMQKAVTYLLQKKIVSCWQMLSKFLQIPSSPISSSTNPGLLCCLGFKRTYSENIENFTAQTQRHSKPSWLSASRVDQQDVHQARSNAGETPAAQSERWYKEKSNVQVCLFACSNRHWSLLIPVSAAKNPWEHFNIIQTILSHIKFSIKVIL